jgi:hypothetical protein
MRDPSRHNLVALRPIFDQLIDCHYHTSVAHEAQETEKQDRDEVRNVVPSFVTQVHPNHQRKEIRNLNG